MGTQDPLGALASSPLSLGWLLGGPRTYMPFAAFKKQVPAAKGLESETLKDSKFRMYVELHEREFLLQGSS